MLLQYLYTGRASLSSAREETLLDFLGLAHRFGLQPLEDSVSEFLRTVLQTHNVCLVFDVASLYCLEALSAACCAYMDRHAPEVLVSDGFPALSKVGGMEAGGLASGGRSLSALCSCVILNAIVVITY